MDVYLGTIQLFAFGFGPVGENWLLCDGRQLLTSNYAALYSLLGTSFGGNSTSFAIPDLTHAGGLYPSPYGQWYIAAIGVYPTRD
jgi:microcystin-dependent protein